MSHKRRTASRRLLFDGELLAEIEETRHVLDLAKAAEKVSPRGLDTEVPRLEDRLAELSERAGSAAVLFVCESLPADTFEAIKRVHPPTDEQLERWRQQAKVSPFATMPEMNPDSMGPDLLEACLREPDWDRDRIDAEWRDMSRGERNQLWNLALGVQTGGADVPFYDAATDMTFGGGESSSSPAKTESPSQSS